MQLSSIHPQHTLSTKGATRGAGEAKGAEAPPHLVTSSLRKKISSFNF